MIYRFAKLAALLSILRYVLCGVALAATATIQPSGQGAQGEMVKARLRLALADSGEVTDTLYFFNNNEWQRIDLTGLSISRVIDYQGPPQLWFYASVPDAVSPQPPIARYTVQSDQQLLLLLPSSVPGERYGVYAVQDDNHSFPAQSVQMINFAGAQIAVSCGGVIKQVSPQSKASIPYDSQGSSTLQIRIASHDSSVDTWKLVRSTALVARGKNRRWLIVWQGVEKDMLILMDRSTVYSDAKKNAEMLKPVIPTDHS